MSRQHPPSTSDAFVQVIIDAAERHMKESDDPEHGFGDLESVLRLCWNSMDAKRREDVAQHWVTTDLVEEWNPLEVPPTPPTQ